MREGLTLLCNESCYIVGEGLCIWRDFGAGRVMLVVSLGAAAGVYL
jgi:hypothetical protein